MTEESLRNFIIEKQTPTCRGEPNARGIANFLAAFQWFIFEADGIEYNLDALETFNYNDINALRVDAVALLKSLKGELGEENWMEYFPRRKNLLDT